MHKPENCLYPNCFVCILPDCEYNEVDLMKDKAAAAMKRRRAAKPEQYRNAQRARRARMELRDPGHYARLAREERQRKERTMSIVPTQVSGHYRTYKSGKTVWIDPHLRKVKMCER